MALDPAVRELAQAPNFATLTTLFPDGQPQTQVVWIDSDDDHLLINTEVHRPKFKNATRDPRVTVTVWDLDNPYRFIEVRGRVVDTVRGDEARRHIDTCSEAYLGKPWDKEITSERVILKIAPGRMHRHDM